MCTNLNSYCVLSRRQCVFEKCVISFCRLDGCVRLWRISTIINTSIWFAKSLCSSITEYRCITVGKKKLARLENNNVCKTKYQRLFFSIFKISYCVRQNEYSVGSGTGGFNRISINPITPVQNSRLLSIFSIWRRCVDFFIPLQTSWYF